VARQRHRSCLTDAGNANLTLTEAAIISLGSVGRLIVKMRQTAPSEATPPPISKSR
jgi:hypothetical protein